ncbi:aggregation-promoting factor C-terminal-like domain-containing protein [Weissella hellenica]|uniref:aggregation-promoting factor C-terminal-like domain-containing protein n=1 Tax=Weissella hellenica TaxID=46256 RepID=UPI0038839A26
MLQKLRQEQSEVNRSTEAGEQTYQKYATQITTAERQLASMTRQQEQAKRAYEMQESGIASLNKEIRQNIQETDAQVERLKAEGKETEANEAQKKGLAITLEKQTKLYEAQSQELKRLTNSGESSTDSISKQKIALERTGKSLAENKQAISALNSEMDKTSPNPFVRLKSSIKSTNKQAKKTHSIFKSVFSASLLSNAVTGTWNSMTLHIGDAIRMGNTYLEQQDKMDAQWKTLAGSNSGAKAMVKGINDLATSAQNSSEMVNGLASQFYAIDKNKDHVLALSKATLTLQDAFGASDDAVQNFGQQWSQMMANGKVSAQDFMSFTNVFPALKPALLDYEKDITHNSNLTMKQLNDMISQGKISSETMNTVLENTAKKNKEATKNFGETIPGMTRTITATMPKLIGELEKPFYKMKNPLVGSISKWITDKDTAKEFNKLGKVTTQALSNITEAFGGSKLNGGKVLDSAIKGLTKSVQEFGKWTATHKKDIKEFFGNFKEKSADTIKVLGASLHAFSVVTMPIIKLMAEHPKVAGTFLAGFMIANKLTAPIAMMGAMGKATKGMYNSFKDSDGIAHKGLSKLSGAVKATGKGIKRGLQFTASVATKGANSAMSGLNKMAKATSKVITKSLKFTANVATKAYKLAMAGLVKTAKVTGNGIKMAFNFLKANPLILLITGITATVVALTTLYKHNKKFKKFVNGLVREAANFAKGVLKWFGKAWSNISSFFKKVINFVKKDWKEILLYIVNPFAGAFALIYKHNAKFRKAINKLVKTVINYFKNMGKNISHIFNGIKSFIKKTLSSISKTWHKAWKSISNFFNKVWKAIKKTLWNVLKTIKKTLVSSLNAYIKLWSKAWKSVSKTFRNIWNGIKKFLRSMLSWLRNAIDDAVNFVYKIWRKGWNKISSFFSNTWRGMKRVGHDAIWSLKNTFDSVLGKIHKAFSNTWNGIKTGFSDMWQGMKNLARDGINAVIKIPNAGISGINGLIHDFGGPKHAIGHIPEVKKFAKGTGAIKNLTHAMLNDGNDSPATGNKEMLVHPNGASELVQGRNTERLLLPGTEVLNASETAMLMRMQGITHFASGTGFWSRLWGGVTNVAGNAWSGLKNGVKKFTEMFKFITNAVAHPVKTLEGKFNPSAKGLAGMFDSFGTAMFKKPKSQAKNWWKTLWSMANDASSAGADGGMKGDDYRFKNRVADSGNGDPWGYFFKECVSFIASRLANSGVPASKFSHLGNGSDWVNAPVRHTNNPKPGMVAVYGPGSDYGNHAAMVTGVQGNKISGEEYNFNYNHKYHQYHGRNASGATTFLDFGLSGDGSSKSDVKTDSPLAKLIKKQTGGMMGWIQKFISPLNDEDGSVGGGTQALPSGSHKHWLEQAGVHGNFDKWNYIINHESSWNPRAKNPSSDAYGIGQALPPSKMASFGSDYMSNPITQLKWMKSYVNGRYGGINEAYRFWQRNHWYENGGIIDKDSIIRVAEKNKPEMIIPLAGDNVRANQLLDEASLRINGKKNSDDGLIEKLLAKKDSGDTYEININVNADVTPNAIKKIQQAVEDAITRKQNARTRAFG